MRLTAEQHQRFADFVLRELADGEPITAFEFTQRARVSCPRVSDTRQAIDYALQRLRKEGRIRYAGHPAAWSLTEAPIEVGAHP